MNNWACDWQKRYDELLAEIRFECACYRETRGDEC
jgi:hypothetical protein